MAIGALWIRGGVTDSRAQRFKAEKDGHEFNMDGLSLIFASSGQEYLEGYVRCSKEGCPATMKYRIFKASAEIPDDWKRELLMR